jgi:YD repeat-containing protein
LDQLVTLHYDEPANPGYVTSMTDPAGKTWTYTYDAGNGVTSTDPLGNTSTACWDTIRPQDSGHQPSRRGSWRRPRALNGDRRAPGVFRATGAIPTTLSSIRNNHLKATKAISGSIAGRPRCDSSSRRVTDERTEGVGGMDDTWETGREAVVLHVLLNDLGAIAGAARTLLERWGQLAAEERSALLHMIDKSVGRGIDQIQTLANERIIG